MDGSDLSFGFAWSDKEEIDLAGIPIESPSTREGLNDWMLEAKGMIGTARVHFLSL